jgi:DNA-binding transcriptional ArsR family regulator
MGAESRFRHAWVPESAIYDKRLGEAFRVFCCLLAFADKNGHCFVKVKTIAALLGKARSTVSEHLSTLERLGYIVREAQFRDDGGKRENRYWVARDGLPDIPPHVGSADAGGETIAESEQQPPIRQRSFLMPIGGGASPKTSSVSTSDNPTSHGGSADIPCRPRTDIKEQTIRTEFISTQGEGTFDAFEKFRPTLEVIDMAGELGVADLEMILENWKDWHRANGKPFPADPNASLRPWIRREAKYSGSRGPLSSRPGISRPKRPCSSLVQGALNRARGS